jgi:hypothetical protein
MNGMVKAKSWYEIALSLLRADSTNNAYDEALKPNRPVIGLGLGCRHPEMGGMLLFYALLPDEIKSCDSSVPASPCHTKVTHTRLTIKLRNGEIERQLENRLVAFLLVPAKTEP